MIVTLVPIAKLEIFPTLWNRLVLSLLLKSKAMLIDLITINLDWAKRLHLQTILTRFQECQVFLQAHHCTQALWKDHPWKRLHQRVIWGLSNYSSLKLHQLWKYLKRSFYQAKGLALIWTGKRSNLIMWRKRQSLFSL